MKIYNSIEEWERGTSELRKNISQNMTNMRTGGDPSILVNSNRINDISGGWRFIIDTRKLNKDICIKDLEDLYNEVVH